MCGSTDASSPVTRRLTRKRANHLDQESVADRRLFTLKG